MSKKEFIKDDMVKILGGASSALGVLKDEVEERIKDKVENNPKSKERNIVKVLNFDDESNSKNNNKIKVKTF